MKNIYYLQLLFCIIILQSCTEPYALQTDVFESAIVIEATITDEYKYQEIKLSRTYKLEETGPRPETGAVVFIEDDKGNHYDFIENNGMYKSQQEFQALPNVTYKLHLVTSDGKKYASTNEEIASFSDIENVTTNTINNTDIGKGVQILVRTNNNNPNQIKYYRYDYEETNKIIAPHWINRRGVVTTYIPIPDVPPFGELKMENWPYEAKICYATEKSKVISISNTSLNNNNSNLFSVRFLKNDDYKIANRYSINVIMYNESLTAYNYYNALKKSSSSESLFSQSQPGFYSGNIKNQSNPNEKIIGFFDVSHVSSKRIFFNFEDLFFGEPKPEYPYYCPSIINLFRDSTFEFCFIYGPGAPTPPCAGNYILESVKNKTKAIYSYGSTEIVLTNYQCGDCSSFSSNIKPAFWID
ncbi:DUF4249 family protein [Flavobacterium sp.]|uniref:DUF4249 family protein n=1 Tax=Flavobacterium sp. TaxID=239 RepID=UPI003753035D